MVPARWLFLMCLSLAGCGAPGSPGTSTANDGAPAAPAADGDHMVSINVADAPPPAPPPLDRADRPWPQAALENGEAWISCSTDYADEKGDGAPLEGLQRSQLEQALAPCAERGLLRVRYSGRSIPASPN